MLSYRYPILLILFCICSTLALAIESHLLYQHRRFRCFSSHHHCPCYPVAILSRPRCFAFAPRLLSPSNNSRLLYLAPSRWSRGIAIDIKTWYNPTPTTNCHYSYLNDILKDLFYNTSCKLGLYPSLPSFTDLHIRDTCLCKVCFPSCFLRRPFTNGGFFAVA